MNCILLACSSLLQINDSCWVMSDTLVFFSVWPHEKKITRLYQMLLPALYLKYGFLVANTTLNFEAATPPSYSVHPVHSFQNFLIFPIQGDICRVQTLPLKTRHRSILLVTSKAVHVVTFSTPSTVASLTCITCAHPSTLGLALISLHLRLEGGLKNIADQRRGDCLNMNLWLWSVSSHSIPRPWRHWSAFLLVLNPSHVGDVLDARHPLDGAVLLLLPSPLPASHLTHDEVRMELKKLFITTRQLFIKEHRRLHLPDKLQQLAVLHGSSPVIVVD